MTRKLWMCLGCVAAALLAAGCHTARGPAGASAPGSSASPATNAAAGGGRSSLEQQAEADARYLAGTSLELSGNLEAALDHFYRAVLADPGSEILVLDVATRFILCQRFDKAAALLEKGIEQPGASALLDSRLAYVWLQMGKTNEAVRASQQAVRKAPRSIIAYENLFQVLSRIGRTNEAAQVITRAAAAPKPDAEFLVGLSELYFLQNRGVRGTNQALRAKAQEALTRAARLDSTNFFVLQKLADGFTQLGDRKQAAATLLKIQERFPELPAIRERLVDLYLREQDKQGAASQLEALVRDNPTNPQAYYLLGIIAFDDHRYDDAAEHFRKTLLLKPDFEPAYYELAVSKINLNQPKDALEVLAQAREKFNDTFLGDYFSALALMRQKDYTNAVQRLISAEIIASATETNRLTHVFYFQLGAACERAGRWTDGEANLKKCLKLSPNFAEALNYLGYMYAEKGTNLNQAREMVEKALQAEPDSAAFIDSLGWIFFKQGRPKEALQQILRAVDLTKEPDATLFDHLGDIYAALREPDKAREAWRKSLSLEPSAEIQKKLDGLKP